MRARPLAVAATSLALLLTGCSVVGRPAGDASSAPPPSGDVVQQSLRA